MSTATLTLGGGRCGGSSSRFDAGERASQYAALAVPLPQGLPRFDRIVFTGRSCAPMRVSVQLRFEQAGGARWMRSVYLSPEPRQIVVPIDQLLPADAQAAQVPQPPPFRAASSVLFVVDLTNAAPGSAGAIRRSPTFDSPTFRSGSLNPDRLATSPDSRSSGAPVTPVH